LKSFILKNEASHIAIIILAAGASKRMGSPKQLLNWGNSSLLGNTIETALKLNAEEVVVVLGANYIAIKKEINHFPVTILNNEKWQIGLGKSLACGVEYLMSSNLKLDGCLITLADQPFIDHKFLKNLISQFSKKKNSIIATSYKDEKYGVPVIFDNFFFDELSALDDDKGAKQILKKYKSDVKALTPQLKNIDIDTIQDYKKYFPKEI